MGSRGILRRAAVVNLTVMATVLLSTGLLEQSARAIAVTVVGVNQDGTTTTVPGGYRWVLEEDTTYGVVPGTSDPNTLAVSFHSSYMPVVAKGDETTPLPALDPSKRYFLSVLPKTLGGFTIGGAPIAAGQTDPVTVYVNQLPLPAGQITISVFEDTQPINNVQDAGEEGLGGFSILLEDAGGRYGISAGMQSQDAFGNPLGTVYQQNPDGTPVLDADGNPLPELDGGGEPIVEPLETGPCPGDTCGLLTIKNLSPGKYGIQAVPPAGEGWQQTSTIEGTKTIDAFVKANEPPYFAEFGPPGVHVAIGFVQPFADPAALTGSSTLEGRIVNLHLSRPPAYAFYGGAPFAHTTPWIGLNAGGSGIYAARGNSDGTFAIPNVPAGDYQLVVWDDYLDLLFAFHNVTVNADGSCATPGGTCDLGDIPVFQWYHRLESWVFHDANGDGFRNPGEVGIPEQNINIRWRDGTVYQSFPTDIFGFVPFDQVFPFFHWLVAEVDFARFKATGATITVDDGGEINAADPWSWGGQLNPQPQSEQGGAPFRTEVGPVLTQAFQGFLGQTNVIEWGKKAYDPGENGGITGIVFYATTRAEDDPPYAAAEPWEPGIPGVTVNLYEYDAGAPNFLGPLVATTTTDSWDATPPTGCQGDVFEFMGQPTDCFDGLRNFNQIRPGVFDGGYAFDGLTPGFYVVEVIAPPGYEIVKEEDRNVDFGDSYVPTPQLLPPECVGSRSEMGLGPVPSEFSLFPLFDEFGDPVAPYRAGEDTPLCNRKKVALSDGANAAADFFLFTEVPIAGHASGVILDNNANEFDPTSPQFGEKFAPPWLPVSVQDWTGKEIARTYSDEFGRYNMLVPSTFTANRPAPSGMSPNMLTTCMNHPTLPNGSADPYFNPQYSTFCYTFQYMPGATTYLDTPVISIGAFAGPDQSPLDCEFQAGTPRIKQASVTGNGVGGGPYVPVANPAVGVAAGEEQLITIDSEGSVMVPNPAYDGLGGVEPKLVARDYGFGDSTGWVTIGDVGLDLSCPTCTWGTDQIVARVPVGTTTGELTVTRYDPRLSSITGVTVQVGLRNNGAGGLVTVSSGESIQAAIDAAAANALILVGPGTYDEMVMMWKPVQLQGWGPGVTKINAINSPAEKLAQWRADLASLVGAMDVDLLPGQDPTLPTEEGAGLLVLAKAAGPTSFADPANQGARVDAFTITGASIGGGVVVNGYADFLEIANNRVITNNGFYGGGVRVGHPELTDNAAIPPVYTDADNDSIRIHHNHITQNTGLGAGGGVSLCTGSDDYEVTQNFICGNFSQQGGGGIGHLGLSQGGLIAENRILFNENFNQGLTVHGGGIQIAGQAPLGGLTLSPGSGSVKINRNLLQGNLAGVGDGGGIQLSRVNGEDVAAAPTTTDAWYAVDVTNNMIVDNVAARAGGGVAMEESARVRMVHNTIVNNDSTATASDTFSPASPNESSPQPAGVVARAHSAALASAVASADVAAFAVGYANPELQDNIIRQNRSFYFFGDLTGATPVYGLLPDVTVDPPVFDDLAVLGTGTVECLAPGYSVLTSLTDARGCDYTGSGNLTGDPLFRAEYFNGNRDATIQFPETTTAIQAPPAFDEGGNFIRLRFGPLTQIRVDNGQPYGDYHIGAGSVASDAGTDLTGLLAETLVDFDGDSRPRGPAVDIGADERRQSGCGLGIELTLLVPMLVALRRRVKR